MLNSEKYNFVPVFLGSSQNVNVFKDGILTTLTRNVYCSITRAHVVMIQCLYLPRIYLCI